MLLVLYCITVFELIEFGIYSCVIQCYYSCYLLQFVFIPVFLSVFFVNKANRLGTLFPTKQVRTLHKKLKFTEKVEKNLTEKQIKRAKYIRLAPSTLNSTVVKKR